MLSLLPQVVFPLLASVRLVTLRKRENQATKNSSQIPRTRMDRPPACLPTYLPTYLHIPKS